MAHTEKNTQHKKSGKAIAGLVLGVAFLLLTLIVFLCTSPNTR
jgi:hypothetical protein